MTIGVLMLASVIVLPIAPVIVGATLTIAGLASTGFFAYKAIKHQLLVNACCGDNNTPEQNLGC